MQHLIQDAKQALPMPDLWRKLGWPGEPSRSCRRPYAPEDTRNKGSVFQTQSGAWLFHDFVSGENFDEVALLARVQGIDNGDACRWMIEQTGVKETRGSRLYQLPKARSAADSGKQPLIAASGRPLRRPYIPPLEVFSLGDVEQLAKDRGLNQQAVALAAVEGFLWRGSKDGFPCWVLTDSERWNAFFRRFGGGLLPTPDGEGTKVKMMSKPWAAWPLGYPSIGHFEHIVMVEGGPDFVAAFQLLMESKWAGQAAVVGMMSSSYKMPVECLAAFAGKRVRMFPHLDKNRAGGKAAETWQYQLAGAGAVADAFDFAGLLRADGRPVKDLNDAMLMDETERAALGLMEGMK